VKRLVKLVLTAGVVAGILAWLQRRPAPPSASPTAPPTVAERPGPVEAPIVPEPDPVAEAWVEPAGDGSCPDGYPVKAKLSSKIFHVPEGALYERTEPDRCYASPEAAEADGLRASKR
jgi:hypothetical protein